MQFPIAIFTIGAVLILIGLVGGDLSYRGLTVPKVGVLPRFTTTVTGGAFLVMSLVVFGVVEFGHEPAEPAAAPVPTASGQPAARTDAGGGSGPAPVDEHVEAVTIRFNDTLTQGAFQEDMEVSVDGQHVGTLHADVAEPSSSIELSAGQGWHAYALAGVVEGADGQQYPVAGEGSFQAKPGSSFDLTVTDAGELGLSRRA